MPDSAPRSFTIAADHPSLPGHFPGRPIVPGIVLLDHVLSLIVDAGTPPATLMDARFVAVVLPGQTIEVAWQAPQAGRIAFRATRDGDLVLRGALTTTGACA